MLQTIGYIFLFLIFLTAIGSFLLTRYLNSLKTVEPAQVKILFEKRFANDLQFQIARYETNEIPAGSLLVIPLIPIPIGSKEKVIRWFIQVLDSKKNIIWKSPDLKQMAGRPGQIQSLSEIDISRKVENIFMLDNRTGEVLGAPIFRELILSDSLPFEIQDLVQFIQENQSQFSQNLGLPIGLIVKYAHPSPVLFKDKTSTGANAPAFSFSYMWLNFFYQTGDGEQIKRHQAKMKLKLDSKGRIDLTQAPDFSPKATDEEKDFVLKMTKELDHFVDADGIAFTEYVFRANQAFKH